MGFEVKDFFVKSKIFLASLTILFQAPRANFDRAESIAALTTYILPT